ncbi:zinc finger in n-recognin protein [Cyclospora cayetanensis]|uniref:E3 ubiquitin-protein ligase n=1 Tax=Cyclospora cayetanensis TaxID=88456 RepID=A0A1D3D5V1_9EIME|nr:zinc finger in n-recognin protein [Cyclospora cayetanensis]
MERAVLSEQEGFNGAPMDVDGESHVSEDGEEVRRVDSPLEGASDLQREALPLGGEVLTEGVVGAMRTLAEEDGEMAADSHSAAAEHPAGYPTESAAAMSPLSLRWYDRRRRDPSAAGSASVRWGPPPALSPSADSSVWSSGDSLLGVDSFGGPPGPPGGPPKAPSPPAARLMLLSKARLLFVLEASPPCPPPGEKEASHEGIPSFELKLQRSALPSLEAVEAAYKGPLGQIELRRLLREALSPPDKALVHAACHVLSAQLEDPHLLLTLYSCVFSFVDPAEALRLLLPTVSASPTVEGGCAFLASLSSLRLRQSRCSQVWDGEHVAYRCLTCGGSQSSCICVACFQAGHHEGHSYFIYRSGCGGCCDCGDASAWSPSGFCALHSAGDSRDEDPTLVLPQPTQVLLLLLLRTAARHLVALCGGCHWESARHLAAELKEVCGKHEAMRRCCGRAFLEALQGTFPVAAFAARERDRETETEASIAAAGGGAFSDARLSLKERLSAPPCYPLYEGLNGLERKNLVRGVPAAPASADVGFYNPLDPPEARSAEEVNSGELLLRATAEDGTAGTFEDPQNWEKEEEEDGSNAAGSDLLVVVRLPSTETAASRRETSAAAREGGAWVPSASCLPAASMETSSKDAGEASLPTAAADVVSPKKLPAAFVSGPSACAVLLQKAHEAPRDTHGALTTLWLALMFDDWVKERFAVVFMQQYETLVLLGDSALERVTVQVLSIRSLLEKLLRLGLLLPQLFSCRLSLQLSVSYHGLPPYCVDVKHSLLRRRAYVNSMNDIRYLLAEKEMLAKFLSECPSHLHQLCGNGFLPLFLLSQGCNAHRRQTERHVEYEDESAWTHAVCLSIDLGQNASVLAELAVCLHWRPAVAFLRAVERKLSQWVQTANERDRRLDLILPLIANPDGLPSVLQQIRSRAEGSIKATSIFELPEGRQRDFFCSRHSVSLHVPLHRLYFLLLSALLAHPEREAAIRRRLQQQQQENLFKEEGETLEQPQQHLQQAVLTPQHAEDPLHAALYSLLGLSESKLLQLTTHALRALIFYHQASNGIWRRNGATLLQECLCYRRAFYQSVTFDVDMRAVRMLFCSIPPQAAILLLVLQQHLASRRGSHGEGGVVDEETGEGKGEAFKRVSAERGFPGSHESN